MVSIGISVGVYLVGLLFSALLMWWTAKRLKVQKVSYLRALAAATAVWLASVLITSAAFLTIFDLPHESAVLAAILVCSVLLFLLFVAIFLVQAILGANKRQGFLICLAYFGATTLLMAGVLYILRPYVAEGFVSAVQSMAPTLTSWHRVAVCPHCGQTLYLPCEAPGQPSLGELSEGPGICGSCFQVSKVDATKVFADRLDPDRFMVNKVLTPRRWDVVGFRDPDDPTVRRVYRLVGLPGETIYIKDGAVWANGARLALPEPLTGLRYETRYDRFPIDVGTEERPLILKESECCVLGDFSQRARDSRFIGPVPWKNLEGVVDLIYWPPRRMRILR